MAAKWKKVLGTVAPLLGGAFGGPMGGMVVTMAAEALGLDAGAKPKDIQKALTGPLTDTQYTALHEADLKFQERCAELDVEEEGIHAEDRKDARDLSGPVNDAVKAILALLTVLGFFATLGGLFLAGEHLVLGTRDVFMAMVGILGGAVIGVYNYYFGSSSGSKAKTAMLSKKD